jgi:hypothetical protein
LLPLDIPVRIGGSEARSRAAHELAKAKYGGLPDWVESFLNRLQALIERLVQLLARVLVPTNGGGLNPGLVVFAILLLLALAFVVWRVGLPRWRRRNRDALMDLDPAARAVDYRTSAERFAEDGDWRNAVRDRFRALVRELEVRTILDVRPARTAWEAATSAGRILPGSRAALEMGADVFSAIAYGDRPADEELYRQMVSIDYQVTAAADRVDLAAEPVPAGAP